MCSERLRRLELYGHDKHHPADEPHRHDANVLVFHLADVDTIDASYVADRAQLAALSCERAPLIDPFACCRVLQSGTNILRAGGDLQGTSEYAARATISTDLCA